MPFESAPLEASLSTIHYKLLYLGLNHVYKWILNKTEYHYYYFILPFSFELLRLLLKIE